MQRTRRMWMITVRPVISNLSPNRIRSANRIRTRIPNRTAHAASQITNEKLFPPTLVYIYMRADKRRSAAAAAQSASLRQREFFFHIIWFYFHFSLFVIVVVLVVVFIGCRPTIVYRYIDKGSWLVTLAVHAATIEHCEKIHAAIQYSVWLLQRNINHSHNTC